MSVLVTVVSFTLTCFSSHLIVTGTDPDAVMPIMSVYRLPQGQYGYSGHVVNLPQDVASFVQSLPRLPSELDVIVVRKEGANQSHRDFRVGRAVVHRALQWLVTHNQYYHSLANNLYQTRTSVKLYSSSVDTPLKLLELICMLYSQESGSIRSPINAEAFPLVVT